MVFSIEMWTFLPTRRQGLNALGLLFLVALIVACAILLWRLAPSSDHTFEFAIALAVFGTLAFAGLGTLISPWKRFVDFLTWRDAEYEKLSRLHAGISIREFERTLGNPLLESEGGEGSLHESLFRGRDYWVQAVYDTTGTVKFFSVTSVSPDFRPTFRTPLGDATLQISFFNVLRDPPHHVRYFTRGATAPSYYFDEYGLGNPSFYRMYTLGANEVGHFTSKFLKNLKSSSPFMSSRYTNLAFSEVDANITGFRAGSIINTYGETDEWSDLNLIVKNFGVGPDPIRIRAIRWSERRR